MPLCACIWVLLEASRELESGLRVGEDFSIVGTEPCRGEGGLYASRYASFAESNARCERSGRETPPTTAAALDGPAQLARLVRASLDDAAR